jgi:thioredoxin reductase (NADPH)
LVDLLQRHLRVEVHHHSEVREVIGNGMLRAVVIEDNHTGHRHTLDAHAMFIFIGAEPHVRWLGDQLALDDHGFILTGPASIEAAPDDERWYFGRPPLLLETSRPGIFAVRDVRSGSIKRVASAVGEGSMAVRLVHEYLRALGISASG